MTQTTNTRKPKPGLPVRLRFVQAWVDGEGRPHHYFRKRGQPRVRLPGLVGSTEFMSAYQAAIAATPIAIGTSRSKPGSVAAAIASYLASPRFKALAPSSQQVRRFVLEAFRRDQGDKLIAAMPKKFIAAMLDAMTPTAARNWLKAIRALVQHCIDVDLIKEDPTLGIRLRPTKGEFHCWTEEEIAAFTTTFPIGTRERLAMALGLYTGQRRGDVIRMGRQHIKDGVLHVRQEKTNAALAIPVHPKLQAVLAAVPATQLTFMQTLKGKPFTGHAFSNWFAKACNKAGLGSQCTFHGLRKAACRRLAEAGCSANEIASISGHATLKEVARYTKAVDQARMARNAMARTHRNRPERQVSKSPKGECQSH
jgi:integrase